MFWSEIAFMLFPTQRCPACEKRRVISRSVYLCSTCEEMAHTFSSDQKKHAPSPSFSGGIANSSMKGASRRCEEQDDSVVQSLLRPNTDRR